MSFAYVTVAGNILLFLLVFNMSATVDVQYMVKTQWHNQKAIAVGLVCQFFILPLLGFLTVQIADLNYPEGIMLLVVTSSPGGSYSNWWCSMFNADLALSVTMTAVSTILSIFMLPLNLYIYTKSAYDSDVLQLVDWASLFNALLIVLSAISLGILCSYKLHNHTFNRIANQCGNVAGISLIIFSATMTNVGGTADTRIWSRNAGFYFAVLFPCTGGVLLATLLSSLCNLAKPERVTVAIEGCYQNVGIATSLALTMFDGIEVSEAIGVPFFYGCVEAGVVGIFCLVAWKIGWTKAPANAPLWNVIMTSYELLEVEELQALDSIEVKATFSNDGCCCQETHEENVFTTYFNLSYIGNEIFNPQPSPSQQHQQQSADAMKTDEHEPSATNYKI